MAHTKAQRAVKGNRDSRSKRRGVKLFGGQKATTGNIIIRQKGSKVHAGIGTFMAKDFTIHAGTNGVVRFQHQRGKMYVHIDSESVEIKAPVKKTPAKKAASKKEETAAVSA